MNKNKNIVIKLLSIIYTIFFLLPLEYYHCEGSSTAIYPASSYSKSTSYQSPNLLYDQNPIIYRGNVRNRLIKAAFNTFINKIIKLFNH